MRSFGLLEIKQFAMYWNTNAHDNWSCNSEFLNLDCLKMIDYSQKYVDNLKRKYIQYQQNFTQNQVYVIQPFDYEIKYRWNLNQKLQPNVPLQTMNIDMSSFLVTLDEEIYKDIQYLTKFFSWHTTAMSKDMTHFKFRPAFNEPIRGNAAKYWKYAIRATIFYLRKQKKKTSGALKLKRQHQTVELSELYKINDFNKWIKANYSEAA